MLRTRNLVLALLLTGGMMAIPMRASAAPDRTFTRYDIAADISADGVASVTMNVDLDFSKESGRGPIFTFIDKMTLPDDKNKYREIKYSDFEITSPSGANTDVTEDSDSNTISYRIGDEDTLYSTTQSYVVTYQIHGLVEPNQAESGLDEFNWNAFGLSSDMAIENPSVTITGPADLSDAACWRGSDYSQSCEATHSGNTATFKTTSLDLYEGMQVVAGFPAGTFTPAANATLGEYPTLANIFRPSVKNLSGAAGIVLVGALGATFLKRRKASDEVYAGITPGTIPADAAATPTRVGGFDKVAVQFSPPAGVLPAEAALLRKGYSDNTMLSATLIDLAVRGYVRIEQLTDNDIRLTRTDQPTNDLAPFEHRVLLGIFQGAKTVTDALFTSSEDTAREMSEARNQLMTQVVLNRRWFRNPPMIARGAWFVAAVALIAAGAALGVLLVSSGRALWGIALAAVGILVLVYGTKASNRTALGSAINAQVSGFNEYISTAEADQLKWEEGQDIFSQYLPWAIIFGETERWTRIFSQLAAEGRYTPTYGWYYSPYGFYGMPISTSIGQLTSSLDSMVSSAATYATSGDSAGLSGSSGFSGGGGGFGGGGSSSW